MAFVIKDLLSKPTVLLRPLRLAMGLAEVVSYSARVGEIDRLVLRICEEMR